MRKAFAGLAILLTLLVVAQFFFAATGAFSTESNDQAFAAHRALGWVIFALPVVMTLVGALARVPGRLIGMTALVAGLTSLQVLIAVVAESFDDSRAGELIFGLHAVNGLVMVAVVATIVRRAHALAWPPAPVRREPISVDSAS